MAGNKFSEFIGEPKKVVGVTIIIVVVIILISVFWGRIKNALSGVKANSVNNQVVREEIATTGVQPSYSDAQFSAFANQLYAAMKGWGTDENAIYNIFKQMKSKVDVLKLIAAFGIRDGEDFHSWLSGEFSFWNYNKLNGILRDNGIDYQF